MPEAPGMSAAAAEGGAPRIPHSGGVSEVPGAPYTSVESGE